MLANPEQVAAFIDLFKHGTKLTYNKGEYIIRPGESPNNVFYIEKGLVKAFNVSKYGEENLLVIRKPHEIFPLIWAITGQGRSIIYQALGPTTVWRLSRKDFMAFLQDNTQALYPFLDLIVEQYRMHSERILNLEYRSARERLISFLLTMAQRFGKKTKDGLLINAPLRQQDIASSINTSRETASRELSFLERKNLICNDNRLYIVLKDPEKLQAYLQ